MLLTAMEVENNPWNVQSIYDLQYFNCPSCIYKINSKQEFVSHAYDFHPESEEYIRNIKDGSINDVDLPIVGTTKIEFKTDLDLSYQSDNLDIKIEEFEDVKVEGQSIKIDDSLSNAVVIADPEEVDSYYCDLCDIYYCNHDAINEHKRVVHCESDIKWDSDDDDNNSCKENDAEKKLKCEQCDKFYVSKNVLNEHVRLIHHGIREYSCTLCGKLFQKSSGLKNHTLQVHEGVKKIYQKYECDQCNKIFNGKSSLRRHIRNIHEGLYEETKVECNICGKKICERFMKEHIKTIHEKIKDQKCPHCEMAFKQKKTLTAHLVRHTGIKNHECSQCEKKFSFLGQLNAHIKR